MKKVIIAVLIGVFGFSAQNVQSQDLNETSPQMRSPIVQSKIMVDSEPALEIPSLKDKINKSNSLVGGVDSSLNANITEGNTNVYAVVTQPDGKILVGGDFNEVNGVRRGSLERFNADGTRDLTFNVGGSGANSQIYVIIPLPGGKILIGGYFTGYNGLGVSRIARLNSNGTLDTSFLPQGSSFNSGIQDMIVQPDGKILVAGNFTSFNGNARGRVARLNADATLDTTFADPAANAFTEELVLQPDGKIVIGGVFSTVAGQPSSGIARLNSDGTLDALFDVGVGVNGGSVYAAKLQSDGKILIGGQFESYNGTLRKNMARINPNGSLDSTFNNNFGDGSIEFFDIQSDGKIVVVGAFFTSGELGFGVIRLNADGSQDSSFPQSIVDDFAYTVAIQADGKILVGGLFFNFNGVARRGFVRLNTNGTTDSLMTQIKSDPFIRDVAQQADGKLIIGGQFRFVDGVARRNVARLNLDGTLDTSFDPGGGSNGFNRPSVSTVRIQPEVGIYVGGFFTHFDGVPANYLVRLNFDGSRDTTFLFQDAISIVRDVDIQADGKIILTGNFSDLFPSTFFTTFVRINIDGSYDNTISQLDTIGRGVVTEIQPDGKLLIGGTFNQVNGVSRIRIARLNTDFTLDTSFDPGAGANSTVFDIISLANGQMYVGGFFTSFNGLTGTNDLVRLNSNGSVDTSFNTGASGFSGGIYNLLLEPDGKILVGGNSSSFNQTTINQLALLNTDGTLDTTFNSPLTNSNFSDVVFSLFRQTDGKILVGGNFNVPQKGLFRLNASNTPNRTRFDFDGDGKSDISVFRPSDTVWYLLNSSSGFSVTQFGISTDKITPADFDGDGRTDIGIYRDGVWYWINSSNNQVSIVQFGIAGDIPVPFDYTGDGRDELAVYRGGIWYIMNLANEETQVFQFGISTDKPVAADYDGDGKTDLAVYRDGTWHILRSSNNSYTTVQFGLAMDIPVVGDYDGDAKSDQAVYRDGIWYVLGSSQGFYAVEFGIAGDIPTAADYDGDGKTDFSVYRNGTWYLLQTQQGSAVIQFGLQNDKPTPSAYLP